MKKLVLLVTVLLFGCLLFSFTASGIITNEFNESEIGFLPANCYEPIHFQIDSQEPLNVFEVNPDTGELSRLGGVDKVALQNEDGTYNDRKIKVRYTVTNADGVTQSDFIIIDLEEVE